MTVYAWERVKDLLHQAMELRPEEREQFLDEACGDDLTLRSEVNSLLAAGDDVRSSFLVSDPGRALGHAADEIAAGMALTPGQIFAERFQLVHKLGEGGMGQVWLAEQISPVRRQVALKLIRAGMYDESVVQRFESERQSLAIMDHPAIAKVFDAGTTALGQPYFVMEYVPGLPIHEYCDRHKLTIAERIELFIQACEGVQHAHQKAILHRDLKPANILVVDVDGKPTPRIIDFGLARATTRPAEEPGFTRFGLFVGTPGYMSPEQADPEVHDIDTRTDVYSLGVILYVLLTGILPFDSRSKKITLEELLRRLREEEVPLPSTKIALEKTATQAVAEARSAGVKQLQKALRGDLDWITMKALERDRSRRYGAPSELAADLHRHLNNEPVMARPASVGYQLKKYAQRHRGLAAGAAVVSVVLLAGIAASTGFAIRASRAQREALKERDLALAEKTRADEQAATANAEISFLEDDLLSQASARGQVRAGAKPDPEIKMRTLLDRAAARIDEKFAQQPLVAASVHLTIGTAYRELVDYAAAQRHIEQAIEIRRKALGDENPETLTAERDLALLYERQAKYKEAVALFNQVLEGQRKALGAANAETAQTAYELGSTEDEAGDWPHAEEMLSRALDWQRRLLGEENADTLLTAGRLAGVYQSENKLPQAESLIRKTLEAQRRVLGEDHPDTLISMQKLGLLYESEAKYTEAEALLHKALEAERRELGEDQRETITGMGYLANLYYEEGKYPEAESLLTEMLKIKRRILGEEDHDTVATMQMLAIVYSDDGKYKEAEPYAEKTVEIARRRQGEEDPDTLDSENDLATLYLSEGRYGEAEALLTRVLDGCRRKLGNEHPDTLASMVNLAAVYIDEGRYQEARLLADEALERNRRKLGEENSDTLSSLQVVGQIDRLEKRYAEAAPLLTRVVDANRKTLGAEHPSTLDAMAALASLRRDQGRLEESDALFSAVLKARRHVLRAEHPDTLDAMVSLGDVRIKENRPADAETLLREALAGYTKSDPGRWRRYEAEFFLGISLTAQKRNSEAETLLTEGYAGISARMKSAPAEAREEMDKAAEELVSLYQSSGRPEKAAEWKSRLSEK